MDLILLSLAPRLYSFLCIFFLYFFLKIVSTAVFELTNLSLSSAYLPLISLTSLSPYILQFYLW